MTLDETYDFLMQIRRKEMERDPAGRAEGLPAAWRHPL